jgi:protein-tyrosine-phosphatase
MTRKVLFLCPHGAAKSVIAAAYAERLAALYELELEVDFAGTEPDEETSSAVVAKLRSEGIDVSEYVPRLVTAGDLDGADWVISMGCDVEPKSVPGGEILHWKDVPPPSQDLDGAFHSIRNHLDRFIEVVF